jgi:two-component system osmolarity sensor histidine kinase EnvZ
MRRFGLELSLFWRTFLTLVALLAVGVFAWVQALRSLELQAQVALAGQQIATLVSLTREAIQHADRRRLPALIEDLRTREAVTLTLRKPGDAVRPFDQDRFAREVADDVRLDLGPQTPVAGEVNGVPGLWVGFDVDAEAWWLRADPQRIRPTRGLAWIGWTVLALALTIAGSAVIARRIIAPLRDLQFATNKINEGEYDSRLDETTLASEIREVNRGFNRMARELAKVEEDRAVMLAGISHDLRTPLARLRLEAEMSVGDEEARRAMAADIDQLDAIIGKFMDYARPGDTRLAPVALAEVVDKEAVAYRDPSEIRIANRLSPDLRVMGDAVELGRVFSNLFENARRYGRTIDTGIASVHVSSNRAGDWVICTVRDRGPGVANEKIDHLTAPFFRGDAARTAATGAGLGLAIVEKAMHRMGGEVELANAPDGGLMVHLRLRHAR